MLSSLHTWSSVMMMDGLWVLESTVAGGEEMVALAGTMMEEGVTTCCSRLVTAHIVYENTFK